ncbi:MAG: hypothetical protein ACJ789_07095 [Thermomicrobiales bacterium]
MNVHERFRELIGRQQGRLRMSVPPAREAAILALLRARERQTSASENKSPPDLVTGRRVADLGGNMALQLCFEASAASDSASTAVAWNRWAEQFLEDCGHLTEAELVLAHCETGFMRMVEGDEGTFEVWIATKRTPTSWRERADISWWAATLAKQHEPELRTLRSEHGEPHRPADYFREAGVYLTMMAYQLGYPPQAMLDGCTIQTYCKVLRQLIARALEARDRGEVEEPQSEQALVTAIASALAADPARIGRAVAAFTLDFENASYHAAVPGVAAAPVVRIDPTRLVWSVRGLTSEPLFFLTRELRRRAGPEYHNTGYLREDVFRQDLYGLFADKRFVTSAGRIALRRADGDVRTDIDAVVFDRKTGTLGVFELKSQDPFARSPIELARQRDNVLYANRQVSGVLDWLNRHGADDLLNRVDTRTAKNFRVQKVFPFVLGRYLVHFNDGPEPDRRAAWGTWPQVLRLLDGQAFRSTDANPLASLFSRLTTDALQIRPPADGLPREIAIGGARLIVYPSYAAFQATTAKRRP